MLPLALKLIFEDPINIIVCVLDCAIVRNLAIKTLTPEIITY